MKQNSTMETKSYGMTPVPAKVLPCRGEKQADGVLRKREQVTDGDEIRVYPNT